MEDATGPYRPSGRRLALMGVFAVVAVAAFILLWDVRFNGVEGGDPVFGGLTDAMSRTAWTVLLLAFEAIAFTGVLLLLLIRPRSDTWTADEWASDPGAPGSDTRIQIGCPGCGTVFEKQSTDVDEPHEQDFRCPNCGRAGRLRMGLHKSVSVRDAVCTSCGRDFKAYRGTAECPHCHAVQA